MKYQPHEITESILVDAIGDRIPRRRWAHQCHAVSIAIVQSDLFEPMEARVLRGSAKGVGGQHSWVHLSGNPYDQDALILDATLWSYDATKPVVWVGEYRAGIHWCRTQRDIWGWGRPTPGDGPEVVLQGYDDLSPAARSFLDLCGPLDRLGWASLADAPLAGWPAKEILTAMHEEPSLRALIPVDALGIGTDLNPGDLYLKAP